MIKPRESAENFIYAFDLEASKVGRLVWVDGRPVPDTARMALGPDHDWRAGLREVMERWK